MFFNAEVGDKTMSCRFFSKLDFVEMMSIGIDADMQQQRCLANPTEVTSSYT